MFGTGIDVVRYRYTLEYKYRQHRYRYRHTLALGYINRQYAYRANPVLAGGPVCELCTGAGKITGTAFFSASTSIISGAGAGVGVGEDDPPPEAVASLLEATSFWQFAPLLMRAQYLGIPNVPLEHVWGPE